MTTQSNAASLVNKHQIAISTVAKFSGVELDSVSTEFAKRFSQ